MRLLIQRAKEAKVAVEGKTVGSIQQGALVLFGVHESDTAEKIPWLVNKLVHLRMFSDVEEKMNLSCIDVKGSFLIVSQFTLYADCSEGRRPSFINSARPEVAHPLYEAFISEVKKFCPVETGIFGAKMQVHLVNDGPVTFLIDSK